MIDHISIAVSDLTRSGAFYDSVLDAIGFKRIADREATIGYGKNYPEFWLNSRPDMKPVEDGTGNHICLRARSKEAVELFYNRALENGGRDDGPPGDRKAELTTYYGAFILDPDGHKIEVVTFPRPE